MLSVPSHKLNFGAFRVAAPTVWNSLPADIRACTFYGSFTRQLKTFYFNNAFYAVRPLVTARASDSMFYPLTMCTLQIVFTIMIMIMIIIMKMPASVLLSSEP